MELKSDVNWLESCRGQMRKKQKSVWFANQDTFRILKPEVTIEHRRQHKNLQKKSEEAKESVTSEAAPAFLCRAGKISNVLFKHSQSHEDLKI